MSKCGIIESVQSWMKFKAQEKLNKKCSGQKQSKLKGIPKLDDANDAGKWNQFLTNYFFFIAITPEFQTVFKLTCP